jgi:hypothetical protein
MYLGMNSPYLVSITCTVSLFILSLILPIITWQSYDSDNFKLITALSNLIILPLLLTNIIVAWHISISQNEYFNIMAIVHVAVSNLSFFLQLFATVTSWAYYLYGNIITYNATLLLTCISSVSTIVGITYLYFSLSIASNKKYIVQYSGSNNIV